MSDENNESTEIQTPQQTGGNLADLPAWVREKLTLANNGEAEKRVKLREKTEEHTDALGRIETLSGEKNAAEERATAAEKALLKYRVAIGTGIAVDGADTFAALLQGNDETELKAHADQLLGVFGKPSQNQQNATDPSQGHGDGESGLSEGAAFLSRNLRGR